MDAPSRTLEATSNAGLSTLLWLLAFAAGVILSAGCSAQTPVVPPSSVSPPPPPQSSVASIPLSFSMTLPDGPIVADRRYEVGLRLENRSSEATAVQLSQFFVDVLSDDGEVVYPSEPRSPLVHGAVLGLRWVQPGGSITATRPVEFPEVGEYSVVPNIGIRDEASAAALSEDAIEMVTVR